MVQIAFIDHYDSFSFNLLDWLWRGGVSPEEICHIYCDDEAGLSKLASAPVPIVFGPGPNAPKDVPFSANLAKNLYGVVPLLGVCLGHQIFAHTQGANIVRAKNPWHGAIQEIKIDSKQEIFAGLPTALEVVCYNSLVVGNDTLPSHWSIAGRNEHNEIMAMTSEKNGVCAWSMQFHPESFLSGWGDLILKNWLQKIRS